MKTSFAIIPLFALTSTASLIPRHFSESGEHHESDVNFPSGSTPRSHQWSNASNNGCVSSPSTNTDVTAVPSPTNKVGQSNGTFINGANGTLVGGTAVGNRDFTLFEPKESLFNGLKNKSHETKTRETYKTDDETDTFLTSTTDVTVTVSPSESTESPVTSTKSSVTSTPATTQKVTTASSKSSSKSSSSSSSTTKTSSSAKSTSTSTKRTGRGTYYSPSSGACEINASESDYVVAIGEGLYESLGVNDENVSTACGKYITASYEGKSVKVKVVDSCASCSDNDIDFSPTAFKDLADLSVGEVQVQWSFD